MRTAGEGQVTAGVGTADVERVGGRKDGRVAAGAGQGDGDQVATVDRSARQFDIAGRVAIDHGGGRLEAERLLQGVGQQRGIGTDEVQLVRRVRADARGRW